MSSDGAWNDHILINKCLPRALKLPDFELSLCIVVMETAL